MKPFAWVNHAVQALATEGSGHSGSYGRHNKEQQICLAKDGTYRYTTNYVPPTPRSYTPTPHTPRSQTPKSRISRIHPTIDLRSDYNRSAPADIWVDSFVPESPPPLPKLVFYDSFDEDLKNARTEFDLRISSEKDSGRDTDSEQSFTDALEDPVYDPSPIKKENEISATIFQSSTAIPITIIVTTPIDEFPEPLENPPELSRSSASFPLGPMSSDPYQKFNTSLLMPPTDSQLDSRKLRKAQEFREIRKWLISFINSKGDKFPRKLRLRMMEAYCIREFDLAPGIVAKFRAEVQDEGVALDTQDGGLDDAASLSILGAAFRSQIEEVTPRQEKIVALPVPPLWQRQGSPTKQAEAKKPDKPEPTQTAKESRPSTTIAKEEDFDFDLDLVPSWLGPLISTSTCSRDSLLSDQQYLKKASSAPNLNPSRPQVGSTDSTHSVPGLRPRGSTVAGEAEKRTKRNNFISGAFGAMRDAMSGRSSKKEEKLQKQKCWDGR